MSDQNSKDPFHGIITLVKDKLLSIIGLISILGYGWYIINKIPDVPFWVKLILMLMILTLIYFFNIRPAIIKIRELNLKPTGNVHDDYFTTSPRENDTYHFFEKGYEKYLQWLRTSMSSILYLPGASGVGKSSLILSYLIKQLSEEFQGNKTNCILVRAYHDPLYQIYKALAPKESWIIKPDPEKLLNLIIIQSQSLPIHNRRIIILDQFEEYFLLRNRHDVNDIDNEFTNLKKFFLKFEQQQLPNVAILLSYRDDCQPLIDQLSLPARVEHVNYEQLYPLSFTQAEEFFTKSGITIPEERLKKVLIEAESIDSKLNIRPIVLNIYGIILLRMTNHPTAWKRDKNLIRDYITEAMGKEVVELRSRLIKSLLTHYHSARPLSVEDLAKETDFDSNKLENQLISLSHYGLVRLLDKEQPNYLLRRWQIAHDFIAIELEKVVYGLSNNLWHRAKPWLAPVFMICLILSGFVYSYQLQKSAIDNIYNVGLNYHSTKKFIMPIRNLNIENFDSALTSVIDDIMLLNPDSISLNHTSIKTTYPLKQLTQLRKLNLSFCRNLKNIESLKYLSSLTFLDLSGTSVSNIESLKDLKSLKKLNLGALDSLKNLEPLETIKSLTELKLYNTTISSEQIHQLENANPQLKIYYYREIR